MLTMKIEYQIVFAVHALQCQDRLDHEAVN
jgi:hypothetical protein